MKHDLSYFGFWIGSDARVGPDGRDIWEIQVQPVGDGDEEPIALIEAPSPQEALSAGIAFALEWDDGKCVHGVSREWIEECEECNPEPDSPLGSEGEEGT